MIVIVDGYNVIRLVESISSSGVISEAQRGRFIRKLQEYAARRKQTVKRLIVVFDGGESRHADRYEHGALTEVYSGFVDSADDWIVHHVSRSGFAEYVLVTNDRGLSKRVKSYVRLVLPVEDFLVLLKESFVKEVERSGKKRSAALVEYNREGNCDEDKSRESLRELMDRSTRGMLLVKAADLCADTSRISGSETDSKELIRIRRIVKKL